MIQYVVSLGPFPYALEKKVCCCCMECSTKVMIVALAVNSFIFLLTFYLRVSVAERIILKSLTSTINLSFFLAVLFIFASDILKFSYWVHKIFSVLSSECIDVLPFSGEKHFLSNLCSEI